MAMEQTIIANKKMLDSFKARLAKEGSGHLLVIADFDRTLTEGWLGDEETGKRVPSLVLILRDEPGYLSPDYAKKAKALADKYHPLELDPSLNKKEKIEAMNEWWAKHFKLLIDSGLQKRDVERVVMSKNLKIRNGFIDLLKILEKLNVPLVINTASGFGIEGVKIFFKKRAFLPKNLYIISNEFVWN
ncbi:MAG: hypothetical protein Q8N55_04175, partial [bacterium]|nr:hypothetical protein [bacterium]